MGSDSTCLSHDGALLLCHVDNDYKSWDFVAYVSFSLVESLLVISELKAASLVTLFNFVQAICACAFVLVPQESPNTF